jgi:hypothetical protein
MGVLRRAIVVALWLLAVYALWSFLGALWAPDACLDVSHGSFDYRTWECSEEQQPYIDTPVYAIPGFWPTLIAFALAVAGTIWASKGSTGDERAEV